MRGEPAGLLWRASKDDCLLVLPGKGALSFRFGELELFLWWRECVAREPSGKFWPVLFIFITGLKVVTPMGLSLGLTADDCWPTATC